MKLKYLFIFSLSLLSVLTNVYADENNRIKQNFFTGDLTISPVPLVGQKSSIKLDIVSNIDDCRNITIKFRIPGGIDIIGKSTFFEVYLPKGSHSNHIIDIEVKETGNYAIQATIYFDLDNKLKNVQHFFVYLIVGENSSIITDKLDSLTIRDDQFEGQKIKRYAPGSEDTLEFSGYIKYYDDNIAGENGINGITVLLLFANKNTIYNLAKTNTDENGFYSFSIPISSFPEGTLEYNLILRILFENEYLKIINEKNSTYEFSIYNFTDGFTLGETNQHRGLGHIFNCIMSACDFLNKNASFRRKQISIRWPYDSEKMRYYYFYWVSGTIFNEYISIPAGREWDRASIFHEYGHSVMTALYGYNVNNLPKDNHQGDHYVYTISDPGLAMKEGWAEFFESLIDDNAFNLSAYINVKTPNIEYNKWWTGDPEGNGNNKKGEIVEGSVASVFWDMIDTSNSIDETPGIDDDEMELRLTDLFDFMMKFKPLSIIEFWNYWSDNSYPGILPLYSIYKNHNISVLSPYDVNKDGLIDISDIILTGLNFGKKITIYSYLNPDVNRDGIVNILDLSLIGRNVKQ